MEFGWETKFNEDIDLNGDDYYGAPPVLDANNDDLGYSGFDEVTGSDLLVSNPSAVEQMNDGLTNYIQTSDDSVYESNSFDDSEASFIDSVDDQVGTTLPLYSPEATEDNTSYELTSDLINQNEDLI